MPIIKPISDLRNRANDLSRICHEEDQPVFITKNGQGDLVVMSQAYYERLKAQLELYQKLDEAEAQSARKAKGVSHQEMIRRMRARLP